MTNIEIYRAFIGDDCEDMLSDLDDYAVLLERVEQVDEEAFEYLNGLLTRNLRPGKFSPCKSLSACIIFRDTPQGNDYWWDIQAKLEAL